MREIKFRAWDTEKHRMFQVWSLTPESVSLVFPENVVGNNPIYRPRLDGDDQAARAATRYLEQLKVMQYTGLKDKNGVEIYEGDVIGVDGKVSVRMGVNFEDAVFKLGYAPLFERVATWERRHDKYEVIGNIYENPELLEQTNG